MRGATAIEPARAGPVAAQVLDASNPAGHASRQGGVLVSDPLPTEVPKTSARDAGWMPAVRAEVPRPPLWAHDARRPRTPAVKEMPAQPDETRHERSRMTTAVADRLRIAGTAQTRSLPRQRSPGQGRLRQALVVDLVVRCSRPVRFRTVRNAPLHGCDAQSRRLAASEPFRPPSGRRRAPGRRLLSTDQLGGAQSAKICRWLSSRCKSNSGTGPARPTTSRVRCSRWPIR